MTLDSLNLDALNKIKACRWDGIIEKHEGPENWRSTLKVYEPGFLSIAGWPVLLPIRPERHANITILRTIVSEDGNSLTVFLKDTTFCDEPDHEMFCAGRLAVCDRIAGEDFFIAVVYHEWFIIEKR